MRSRKDIEEKYTFHLEVHDFGFILPGLDDILRLKNVYPDFKITCFTVPIPREFYASENVKHFTLTKYEKWAKIINSYDWMEIGMHGFSHTKMEMDTGYDKAIKLIEAGENMFKRIGLNYKKIFVAPFWQYSYDSLMALRDKGYIVGLNRNNPVPYPPGTKVFYFTWSVEEPVLPANVNVIAHSHTTNQGVNNGLSRCYNNIINILPRNARFGFLSELIEKQYEEKNNSETSSGEDSWVE